MSMFISHEKLDAEVKRLAALDLVSRTEVETAVATYIKVSARVHAVAKIVSNLEEKYRGVDQYDWRVQNFTISTKTPNAGMEHLNGIAVSVMLYARRHGTREEEVWIDRMAEMHRGTGCDEGREIITRTVQFPIDYLTSDNWLDHAKRVAMRHELYWLKTAFKQMPSGVESRRRDLAELEDKIVITAERIAEIEALGVTIPELDEED